MTELDVYAGICEAVYEHLGHWAVVYGDFTVSTGSKKRGGVPTPHVLAAGETLILDFSVIVQGYRSDFTNTLVVGGRPTAEQQNICVQTVQCRHGCFDHRPRCGRSGMKVGRKRNPQRRSGR
jgi:Xaa-Pro aminopeptidase